MPPAVRRGKPVALGTGHVFRRRSTSDPQRQHPNQCRYYPPCGVEQDSTGTKKRLSTKGMRKAAAWDDSLLTDILAQVFNEVAATNHQHRCILLQGFF